MPKHKTVEAQIESLARAVKRGFDETSTKRDLLELERRMSNGFKVVADSLDLMRADLREVQFEITRDLRKRVERLEAKVGLTK